MYCIDYYIFYIEICLDEPTHPYLIITCRNQITEAQVYYFMNYANRCAKVVGKRIVKRFLTQNIEILARY